LEIDSFEVIFTFSPFEPHFLSFLFLHFANLTDMFYQGGRKTGGRARDFLF